MAGWLLHGHGCLPQAVLSPASACGAVLLHGGPDPCRLAIGLPARCCYVSFIRPSMPGNLQNRTRLAGVHVGSTMCCSSLLCLSLKAQKPLLHTCRADGLTQMRLRESPWASSQSRTSLRSSYSR